MEHLNRIYDRGMIDALYRKHRIVLLKIANQVLHDADLAEDAVQQAFEALIMKFRTFSFTDDVKTTALLKVITKRSAINILLKRDRRHEQPLEDELVMSQLHETKPSMEDVLITKINVEKLSGLIGLLEHKYAEILTLSYLDNIDDRDISKMLNISHANVRTRKTRAKQKLKELYLSVARHDDE
jgi:RNA polymerase sigma-70 factor (ECF subfamily)